jgi:hypothetical protein
LWRFEGIRGDEIPKNGYQRDLVFMPIKADASSPNKGLLYTTTKPSFD